VRVLVIGARGQLGSELILLLREEHEIIPATRAECDITDLPAVLSFVRHVRPQVIINTAAYTDVDGCESNKDMAFKVNALGARNVAIAAREFGARLVHISTDYIFDGQKSDPYREYDQPNPINVYGASKLLGETFVKEQTHRFFIVRTAWLYGKTGRNFVKTMLRLAHERKEIQVVNDQWGTPTCAEDLARQIGKLIQTESYGTYHCTSQGSCTWFEFAQEIFRLSKLDVEVRPVTSDEFPRPAKRPKNSVLENYMLKLQGLDIMPPWEESLERFMKAVKKEVLVQ
jgi:dTDP-4-dehydrorhamnose reductase